MPEPDTHDGAGKSSADGTPRTRASKSLSPPSAGLILSGLALGALSGAICKFFWGGSKGLDYFMRYGTDPAGQVWLRALIMIVIPLVFAVLSLSVAELGDYKKLGKMGLEALALFVALAALAGAVGLLVADAVRPGAGVAHETRAGLLAAYQGQATASQVPPQAFGIQTIVRMVPRNPIGAAAREDILGVIVFSLIFGLAMGRLPAERTRTLREAIRGLGDVMTSIIDLVMLLAPYAVFALVFSAAGRFGLDLLEKLAWYLFTVIAGLAIMHFGVYSLLLAGLARRKPREFFRRARVALATAFSTSSSVATLPTTIHVSEKELGLPPDVCGLVLPLGASMNKAGSAVFEAASVVFIAQVLGMKLAVTAQVLVIVLTVFTAGIGVVGVPSAVIPLMISVLAAVGIPGEGIALIIGVERLLDMCRTTVNVGGHMVAAAIVARTGNGRELRGSLNTRSDR